MDPRSEGGGHDPDRLVTLCGAHHRAVHEGALVIEGAVSAGLIVRHADGSRYGAAPTPAEVDLYTRTFGALRRLGFRETETKRALESLRNTHVGELSIERIVREAMLHLTR